MARRRGGSGPRLVITYGSSIRKGIPCRIGAQGRSTCRRASRAWGAHFLSDRRLRGRERSEDDRQAVGRDPWEWWQARLAEAGGVGDRGAIGGEAPRRAAR